LLLCSSLRSKYLNYVANYSVNGGVCTMASATPECAIGVSFTAVISGWLDYRSVNCIDSTIKSRQRADWQNVDTL